MSEQIDLQVARSLQNTVQWRVIIPMRLPANVVFLELA